MFGAAYRIAKDHVQEVKEYLDIREINGYSIQYTPFIPSDQSSTDTTASKKGTIQCLVYIGLPDNPQFVGPQDPETLTKHILRSKGPSGENREYLYMLEEALLSLSTDSQDAHISDLAARCHALEKESGWNVEALPHVGSELHRVGSTEEQEEVEKTE